MNLFHDFQNIVLQEAKACAEALQGAELSADLPWDKLVVEPPREATHGDMATNAALVLSKPLGVQPRVFAEALAARLQNHPDIVSTEVAGPGFLNLRLKESVWHRVLAAILKDGDQYGKTELGAGQQVNVEYVSANPTGPMHAGHARIAVVGDVLAALMEYAGYTVTREYYINDSGGQAENLARSVFERYREMLEPGYQPHFPEGHYPGDYIVDVAESIVLKDGPRWLGDPESEWLDYFRGAAVDYLMTQIRENLKELSITQEVFSSENALVLAGAVERAIAALETRGLIYRGVLEAPKGKPDDDWEPREQLLFRATDFGDDVDRPLQRSDGSWTYFAKDIAYHYDKIQRGSAHLIDVLGADHGGYAKRMKAAVSAISDGKAHLDVRICQLVKFMDQGQPLKMSKRSGSFITLSDIIERVGADVLRFIMMTRKDDAPLDFDFAKAVEQSQDNPVFYVQYAYARASSVVRHAQVGMPNVLAPGDIPLEYLTSPAELFMIKVLSHWPRQVEMAARTCEPHRLAYYLMEVAAAFHALWNSGKGAAELRFIVPDAPEVTRARLALIQATRRVIASGLGIFGVTPMEEMTA